MIKGKIKWYSEAKGFGFCLGEDGKQYFVHNKTLKDAGLDNLADHQAITFEPMQTTKGFQATKIQLHIEF